MLILILGRAIGVGAGRGVGGVTSIIGRSDTPATAVCCVGVNDVTGRLGVPGGVTKVGRILGGPETAPGGGGTKGVVGGGGGVAGVATIGGGGGAGVGFLYSACAFFTLATSLLISFIAFAVAVCSTTNFAKSFIPPMIRSPFPKTCVVHEHF
jgi:hypothetical protein